jgi:Aminomethyltransferase folate-binding domain
MSAPCRSTKSRDVLVDLFGDSVLEIPYYSLREYELQRMHVVVSRTGHTSELGFEIYCKDAGRNAERLWELVLEAGAPHGLRDRALPHPPHRGRHPRLRSRHVARHEPVRGRHRLRADGRPRPGRRLRRQGSAPADQGGGDQAEARRRRDRREEARLLHRRDDDRLLPDLRERRPDRQRHLRLLLASPRQEHRLCHAADRVRRARDRGDGRDTRRENLGRRRPQTLHRSAARVPQARPRGRRRPDDYAFPRPRSRAPAARTCCLGGEASSSSYSDSM